jgi:hypothetical protein
MELDVSKIDLSLHCIERAYERMNVTDWKKDKVCKYVKKQLEKSTYIGRISPTDGGTDSEMFTKGSYSFLLDTELTTIKTIIKTDRLPYNPSQEKAKCLYEKEFRKLDRKEKARLKQLELHRYEVDLELAELKLHIFKTRSQAVKLSCQARMKALDDRLKEFENEIVQIKNDKRQTAYVLAMLVG